MIWQKDKTEFLSRKNMQWFAIICWELWIKLTKCYNHIKRKTRKWNLHLAFQVFDNPVENAWTFFWITSGKGAILDFGLDIARTMVHGKLENRQKSTDITEESSSNELCATATSIPKKSKKIYITKGAVPRAWILNLLSSSHHLDFNWQFSHPHPEKY